MAIQALDRLVTGNDSSQFKDKIRAVATDLGIDANMLTIFMHFESGLSASIKNKFGYVGLIQFGSDAASDVGSTQAQLQAMNRVQQMDYVEKYFKLQFRRFGQKTSFVDLYLLINYPAVVNVTNDCVPLPYTTTARENNPALQNAQGYITKSSIYDAFYKRYLAYGIDITQYQTRPDCSSYNYGNTSQFPTDLVNNKAQNVNTDLNFQQIETNIENAEFENTTKSWGSRTRPDELSDFIGLKQYLLYLTTRFYPQNLLPFIELIPIYSIDTATNGVNIKQNINSTQAKQNPDQFAINNKQPGYNSQNESNKVLTQNNFENTRTLLDESRFNKTANQLNTLSTTGGADLFSIDPFLETSDSFNMPNDAGKQIIKNRGYGYKIFGTISLNPPIEGDTISKAGAIGLREIEIETGSQVQHGMTLITMKFLDVQGNKFLDINSPWSFILNSRPGGIGADFYFRFGWQVRIPDPKTKDDAQATRFWNHPGWRLFSSLNGEGGDIGDDAKVIKNYIQSIASHNDQLITLTQSPTLSSMNTPGYRRDEQSGTFELDRKLNPLDYMSLVLINPELNVNPQDGSIEATLFFRSTYAVANCLALLNGSNLPVGKNNVPVFRTKQLVNLNNSPTLTQLMQAFVDDNRSFIFSNPNLKNINNNKPQSVFLADHDIKDWLTVIGGAGTDSLIDIDPDSIIVKISNDSLKAINESNIKDTRPLIAWLRGVLEDNNLAINSAGSVENNISNTASAAETLNGGFIISYDSDKQKEKTNQTITGKNLALKDPSFGDFLNYTNPSSADQNFVGKRLFIQDDVFAFRFQGSLVEEFNIERLETPTQTTIQANKNLATDLGEDENSTDVKKNIVDQNGNVVGPNLQNVTVESKKRQLNLLYSTMLGLKVRSICHPWLKIGRPAYVKGMGFWDGKYFITKIKHILGEDNRLISEINACRIINNNNDQQNSSDTNNSVESAMNNPSAKKATTILNPIKSNPQRNYVIPSNTSYDPTTNNILSSNPLSTTTPDTPLRASLESYIQNLHYNYQSNFRNLFRTFENNSTQGYKILITSGYRSWAEQATLKAQNPNNASPGYSMHNYGLAVDLNITDSSGNIIANKSSSDDIWINTGIISLAKGLGFTWGGTSFGEYKDRVHFGFDNNFDKNVLRAMAILQFGSNTSNIQGNKLNLNDSSNSFADNSTPASTGTQATDNLLNLPSNFIS